MFLPQWMPHPQNNRTISVGVSPAKGFKQGDSKPAYGVPMGGISGRCGLFFGFCKSSRGSQSQTRQGKKGNGNSNVAIWILKVNFFHLFCAFFFSRRSGGCHTHHKLAQMEIFEDLSIGRHRWCLSHVQAERALLLLTPWRTVRPGFLRVMWPCRWSPNGIPIEYCLIEGCASNWNPG